MPLILALLLQAAPTAAPVAPPPAPWTPVVRPQSVSVYATSRENSGRLAVRCDTRADKVVSVQFIPTADIGASPQPGRPVSLTIDAATPLIANWEFPGRGALEREDAAVTTIVAALAKAKAVKLHTVNAAGEPVDATFTGPTSDAGLVQVLGACGYTLGQVPARAPAPTPAGTPAPGQ